MRYVAALFVTASERLFGGGAEQTLFLEGAEGLSADFQLDLLAINDYGLGL